MIQRVMIVCGGQWGSPPPPEEVVELYRKVIGEARDFKGKPEAEITAVDSAEEAEKKAKEADVVVFLTRSAEVIAERIARNNPQLKVVVFAREIPPGKVIWVNRGLSADSETIRSIVLHY